MLDALLATDMAKPPGPLLLHCALEPLVIGKSSHCALGALQLTVLVRFAYGQAQSGQVNFLCHAYCFRLLQPNDCTWIEHIQQCKVMVCMSKQMYQA